MPARASTAGLRFASVGAGRVPPARSTALRAHSRKRRQPPLFGGRLPAKRIVLPAPVTHIEYLPYLKNIHLISCGGSLIQLFNRFYNVDLPVNVAAVVGYDPAIFMGLIISI